MNAQTSFLTVIAIGAAMYILNGYVPGDAAAHLSITSTAHDLCLAGVGGLSPHAVAAAKKLFQNPTPPPPGQTEQLP